MTCNVCLCEIAERSPIVLLKMAVDGIPGERFTGVVWHPECAPAEREHLLEEARALAEKAIWEKRLAVITPDWRDALPYETELELRQRIVALEADLAAMRGATEDE